MENGDSNASQDVEPPNGEYHLVQEDTDTNPVMSAKPENIPFKINGDTTDKNSSNEFDSSDCDALVIDESVNVKKGKLKKRQKLKSGFRGFSKAKQRTDILTRNNPLFTESLNELSELLKESNSCKRSTKSKPGNPKLREYAQYLGLQPAVQFKCPKCTRSGFDSLPALNDHHMHCKAEAPIATPPQTQNPPSSTLRVSRKVYLCSACGTYYENWNLFLHMREVHRRFICLYCLGMFSNSEKLAQHLVVKHSCVPSHRNTLEDFLSLYKEPCFLMCCDCEKVFSERDNFFTHECVRPELQQNTNVKLNNQNQSDKPVSKPLTPEMMTQNETSIQDDVEIDQKLPSPDSNSIQETTEELSLLSSDGLNEIMKTSDESRAKEEDNHIEEIKQLEGTEELEGEEDECGGEEVESDGDALQGRTTVANEGNLQDQVEETRKVPKVTLKLSKSGSYPELIQDNTTNEDSTDSVQLMATEEPDASIESVVQPGSTLPTAPSSELQVAGPDIGIVELALEQPLDKFDLRLLLRKCLSATAPTCIYCNHARRIAVCGKQLGLHAIAEHRFSGVVNSITAEELIPESFVARISEGLSDVEGVYFNLEDNESGEDGGTFSHVFECFQCRFSTAVHKELYLHNRKSHAKTILLCIMCKSNFYSYSELICHLCPGVYALDNDVHFRCCMCVSDNLPSAFRLMVHLRKKHNVCDVCLEFCHNQSKLSNHVWKHKLHHLCYRCGIAYRNKPDITKHLFWKHGTESVLCKKCLQKKWPHVYHFCIPPMSFLCEECSLTFSRAVSLKVHKRTHSENKPHKCTVEGCTEAFISKKLLLKHEFKHREPQEEPKPPEEPDIIQENILPSSIETHVEKEEGNKEEEKPKPKVDVYDLPALNLSESDSSDSEDEKAKTELTQTAEKATEGEPEQKQIANENATSQDVEMSDRPVTILENVWDDFKNYQANMGKLITEPKETTEPTQEETADTLLDVIMKDHDYCNQMPETIDELNEVPSNLEAASSMDHDYFSPEVSEPEPKEEAKAVVTQKEQSSSSDSDSSSCTCGSNCSCSSSSGSSSSSSDSSDSDSSTSEGRRRQQARRERRKEKNKSKEVEETIVKNPVLDIPATVVQESDLETTESETDEDFYDEQPQKLASQMIAEKRNQLIAELDPVVNGGRPPNTNAPEEVKQKKKTKSKKRKKKKAKYLSERANNPNQFFQTPTVAPITLSIPRNSPVGIPSEPIATIAPELNNSTDSDHLRASKRRRVPNKFYGYSSDEENEKQQPKWRKSETTRNSPLLVPPITIKTLPHLEPPSEMRIQRPPDVLPVTHPHVRMSASETESSEEEVMMAPPPRPNQPALYCYCRCPYDEVSEMIGCDSSDCAIEWFHFECVGIMVPPKGQWFCPDCRKKKQQKRDLLQMQT